MKKRLLFNFFILLTQHTVQSKKRKKKSHRIRLEQSERDQQKMEIREKKMGKVRGK